MFRNVQIAIIHQYSKYEFNILSLLIGGTFQTYQGVQKLNVLKIEYRIEMQIEKTGIDKIKLHWTDLR